MTLGPLLSALFFLFSYRKGAYFLQIQGGHHEHTAKISVDFVGLPHALIISADSDTPTEDMIRRSIALGLEGICFTEHLDPDYPPLPMTWNSPLIFRLTISGLWS